MDNQFFERPILNSPYDYPTRYWELDEQGQPTQQIVESRREGDQVRQQVIATLGLSARIGLEVRS